MNKNDLDQRGKTKMKNTESNCSFNKNLKLTFRVS